MEMDLVSSCREKLVYFRIKELKDVLTQLGLSKQGKKQDLVDRILDILSDERVSGMWSKKNAVGKEEVAKLVDDIYRKMQVAGATDLASKGQGVSDGNNVRLKEEIEDPYPIYKIRCPCGNSLQTDSMIKCEDTRCRVWQHIGCVIIPEKLMEGVLPVPEVFYCEMCRLNLADPFWITVAHPLYPVNLTAINISTNGTNPVQNVERTFQLTRADKDLLSKQEYGVQAWCMLLNDKVLFRMQWPQHANLQVNGVPVQAINRPGSQLLGANGRDDGPIITPCTRDGINKISLTWCDSRVFWLGVRIVKRRTVQQVLNMIPKESDGEPFEDALARVCRCVSGGTATDNADSDSDLEIVADSIPVNLRCPMSGSRIKVAGRFKPCLHMGCFDLEVFVEMNQQCRKWQCPICLKNYSLENIIIDPYFNRITSELRNCGDDITEIDVKPDGSWRAKAENDHNNLGDLGLWHFPDGTFCPAMDVEPNSETFNHFKQGVSEGHASLKLKNKKNRNGFWEVSKPEDMHAFSAGCTLQEKFENYGFNFNPVSGSATGSGRDGEDRSVNQDGGGSVNQDGGRNFDFSTNNGIELDSISMNIDQTYGFTNHNSSAHLGDADVIVLSDSEEENDVMFSPRTVYNNNRFDAGGVTSSVAPNEIPDSYPSDSALRMGDSSCLSLFNANDDEFAPVWFSPSGTQAGTSFQLFGSDADISAALVDLQPGSSTCPMTINGYTLTAETATGSVALVPESLGDLSNANTHGSLVDNPLAFGGDDPSLQIFLPTRTSDASPLTDLRDQPDASNSSHSEDWISLRLGAGGNGSRGELAAPRRLNSEQQFPSKEGAMDLLAGTALSVHPMNDDQSGRTGRETSDSPFMFPCQRRSGRPRPYLSIDTDSE